MLVQRRGGEGGVEEGHWDKDHIGHHWRHHTGVLGRGRERQYYTCNRGILISEVS